MIFKRFVLLFVIALCAINVFSNTVKGKEYYAYRYLDAGNAENNARLLFAEDAEFREAIEKKYIDVNFKYKGGVTLLYKVLRQKNYEPENFKRIAEFLIKNGADVNIADDEGDTPLLYAVQYCYISQKLDTRNIDLLLKYKADVKVVNKDGESVLYYLCAEKKPDLNLIKKFIKLGAPINTSGYNFTPLTRALDNENIELAKLLIESGADVNLKNHNNKYPLCMACDIGDLSLVKYMISKGANVNVTGKENYTPLLYAADCDSKDSLEIVKLLVEKGAKVNVSNDRGYTPLIYACWDRYHGFEIIKYLVSKKADINAKTKDGYNVGMACGSLLSLECYKFLEKNGFNFKATDENRDTVLHYFINTVTCSDSEQVLYYSPVMQNEKEVAEIIEFLVQKCGVNTKNRYNETVLFKACSSVFDYTKIIEPLIKCGADVNVKDESGRTPIFQCSASPEMVQMLVDAGADLSVKDKWGKTYLDRCEEALKYNPKMSDVVAILKANSKVQKEYSFIQLCEYNYTDKVLDALKKGNVKEINDYDASDYTPLFYAVINKNPELVKALLDKGADINQRRQKYKTTVLYYAVNNVQPEMVKLLLEYKPDLSMMYQETSEDYEANIIYTCIHSKFYYNKKETLEILKMLLEAGADPNSVIGNRRGTDYTVTVNCCESAESEIIELLIEYGGDPFKTYTQFVYQYSDYITFSILRTDLQYNSISSERQYAVFRGLEKYYKNKTLVAIDNLRLRSYPGRSKSPTITAIKKGTKVKVLEAYQIEDIDNILSCWVKVEVMPGSFDSEGKKLATGTTGWCFLGYLEVAD